jgi:transposase InsO family protein
VAGRAQREDTLYRSGQPLGKTVSVESFNGSLRDECLDRELMLSVAEARVLIEDYRRHYNEERPHGGIGYRTPAQARREALGSSRPPGSLRPELDPFLPTTIIPT